MSQPLISINLDYDLPTHINLKIFNKGFFQICSWTHTKVTNSLFTQQAIPHFSFTYSSRRAAAPAAAILRYCVVGRILRQQAGTQLHSFCPSHPRTDIGESDNPTSMRAVQHQESLQFSRERGFSCNFNYNTLTPWWSIQFKKQAFPKLKTAVTDRFPAYYCRLQISLTKTSNCITEIQCRGHTTLDGRKWPHIWQQAWLTMSQQLSCNTG